MGMNPCLTKGEAVARQPAISISDPFQFAFNRTGEHTQTLNLAKEPGFWYVFS